MADPGPSLGLLSELRRHGFGVELEGTEETVVLRLHGELDMATVPILASALTAALDSRPPAITLDLSDLTFVDSCGIGGLISGFRKAGITGCTLALRYPTPRVRTTLCLIGIDRIMVIDSSHADAEPAS